MAKTIKPQFKITPSVLDGGPTYRPVITSVRVENRQLNEMGGNISVSLLNADGEVIGTRCVSTQGLLTKDSLLKALKFEPLVAKPTPGVSVDEAKTAVDTLAKGAEEVSATDSLDKTIIKEGVVDGEGDTVSAEAIKKIAEDAKPATKKKEPALTKKKK